MNDSSFDSFGDFGDFQTAGSDFSGADGGSLTPTGIDSWSFTSASSAGSFDEGAGLERRLAEGNQEQDERTARDN